MNSEIHELNRIINFLSEVGFNVQNTPIETDTFLPGIMIHNGAICYDEQKLKHPGDLLHEAGHLAVVSPEERKNWRGDFTNAGGLELGAIAWSYAACLHIELPVGVVFHPDGYKGESEWLIETLNNGGQLGVPILQWKQMTNTSEQFTYPNMEHWLSLH